MKCRSMQISDHRYFEPSEKPKVIYTDIWNLANPVKNYPGNSQRYVMVTFDTKNPPLGMICPGDPHQGNPNAPKFEDRSQEETEWRE